MSTFITIGILLFAVVQWGFILYRFYGPKEIDPKTKPGAINKIPLSTSYYGGIEEKILEVPSHEVANFNNIIAQLRWLAKFYNYETSDYFMMSLIDPSKVVFGRKLKLGDMVEDKMVVRTSGLHADLLTPEQAMKYFEEEYNKEKGNIIRLGNRESESYKEHQRLLSELKDAQYEAKKVVAWKEPRYGAIPAASYTNVD